MDQNSLSNGPLIQRAMQKGQLGVYSPLPALWAVDGSSIHQYIPHLNSASSARPQWIWASPGSPLRKSRRGLGVSRERCGDLKDAARISRNSSDDIGDLEGEEKTGPPMAEKSAVHKKDYRLSRGTYKKW